MVIFSAGKIMFAFYVLITFKNFPTFLQAFVTFIHQPLPPPIIDTLKNRSDVMGPGLQGLGWVLFVVQFCSPSACVGNGVAETRGDVNKAADFEENEDPSD